MHLLLQVQNFNYYFCIILIFFYLYLGIKYIDNSVFTTSTDQRLNKWQINYVEDQGVSLTLVDAAYMDVPDPSALDAVSFK